MSEQPRSKASLLSTNRMRRRNRPLLFTSLMILNLVGPQPPGRKGVELEMIFVMPQEITGQPNSRVLCRGEVARAVPGKSGTYILAVIMSGYSFLPDE